MTESISKVVANDCCIGCGGCGVSTGGGAKVFFNEIGLFQADVHGMEPDSLAIASQVCPWADESEDETAMAARLFDPALAKDERIGMYRSTMAARVVEQERVEGSSSGGMTSWVAQRLLEEGLVDGVIHVGGAAGDKLFEYRVSTTVDEIITHRKSMYYSVSFAEVLESIRGDGRRYAFVGIPCFVKAVRSLAEIDATLQEQIIYYLGLVCGHLKSSAYAESMAWQLGVEPDAIGQVDFRIKNPKAGSRGYQFGVRAIGEDNYKTSSPMELVGGSWGHSVFQPNACNFCDDIYAETADVVFADAWLPKYEADWRGHNIVVTRNEVIDEIISNGFTSGLLEVEPLEVDAVAKAQAGNYRHRRLGLRARLMDDIKSGRWVPRKRVIPGYAGITRQRLGVIRQRRQLSAASFGLFQTAKEAGNLEHYLKGMIPLIAAYDRWSKPSYAKRAVGKAKRSFWLIAAKHQKGRS
ncbi:Coenzyme F420 hydrogenase/dehydrogenase, beta subunit C-terminal domain [uncultured Kocuria sp.]|uniref:Coenzyme F420 hydrogenase/dehydrogenase, beta subunit C-terminal domain n=1 Tax=uncultured Kocuria sp. TaxID=259305 RepID=UPI002624939C|nr:Coenzyme F420 hydrogenase/dehydrogenase, beta subunit C-terminal domain [uncultured Kocuria sp.]